MLRQIHPQLLAHGLSYRELLRVPMVGKRYDVVLVMIRTVRRIVLEKGSFPT